MVVPPLPDLTKLSHAEKDALIVALWQQVVALTARVEALEQKLSEPPKTPDNSSLPPSKGQKANRSEAAGRVGPRKGSLGRKGGGRSLIAEPDQVVSARAAGRRHSRTPLGEADHHLHSRYDKIELPPVRRCPIRRRHGRTLRRRRLHGYPKHAMRVRSTRTRVSRYLIIKGA